MEDILEKYKSLFGSNAELTAAAPGRINLIGEHTDYNKGFVLPAAIDRYMYFAFGKSQKDNINLHSFDLKESIKTDNLNKEEKASWANYFIGILLQLKARGIEINGFNLVFGGNIPIGGGLSSSSALECGFLKILNEAYDLDLDHMSMIEISMASNHEFLGLQGGIMDQYSILHGQANHAMLLNCETNTHEQIPISLKGYRLLLIDSKVSHSLVNSAYNDRVKEGKEALAIVQNKFPEVRHLSMVKPDQLSSVEKLMTSIHQKRSKYIIEENRRVRLFCKALSTKNMNKLGELLYASHEGLQNDYEVSCQELDLLVNLAKKSEDVLGARMIGGGFGGCTLNLIRANVALSTALKISSSYKAMTGISSVVYDINIGSGVSVMPVSN